MRNQMFQQFGGAGGQDLDLKSLLPDEMFSENAERRVKLGLVLAEPPLCRLHILGRLLVPIPNPAALRFLHFSILILHP